MEKVDHKREIASYSARQGRFDIITVPSLTYVMIDGHGDPNASESYRAALETLFPVSYKLKFLSKRELGRDYTVMPLEALWWADDMESFTSARDKSQWSWTTMIMVPAWLGQEHVDAAVEAAGDNPSADLPRLEELDEGLCVQTLHVGPYDDEAPTLAMMHDEFIPAQGLVMTGRHHEIYLSDARRTAPERLRTILRQPVKAA